MSTIESLFASIAGVNVLPADNAAIRYGADTGGANRILAGALIIQDEQAVPRVLHVANAEGVRLWPISGGGNFGYGTSLSVGDNNVILDLSELKHIEHHPESQSFTLGAGVTQWELADYLDRHGLPYLVPTTGLGPSGSLIGNALDGGYGLTPIVDHFEALSNIDGYWGDGTPLEHRFRAAGCDDMARRWPAGLGPAAQMLLRQSNLAVVTRATVRLARVPEDTRILVLEWPSEQAFIDSQDALSRLIEELPLVAGIICMNSARILSTQADAPLTSVLTGQARSDYLERLAKERRIAPWTGVGTLYGPTGTLKGAVRDLRRRLPEARMLSFSPRQVRWLKRLADRVPQHWFPAYRRHLGALVNMLGTVEGRPILSFLRIAYALDASRPAMSHERHPARDGQGILWYAPLVPLTADKVRDYIAVMSEVLLRYGFDPLLAVTTRGSRVHSATIPILYRKTPEEARRARACYADLVQAGLGHGMPPYRIGIDTMYLTYTPPDSACERALQQLKAALDPNDVIAPGRYTRPLRGAPTQERFQEYS